MEKVIIERMDHQGRGIGKINNLVIFIPNTLIGEEVKIKIEKERKHYLEGEALEFIKTSDKRINPKCPYFEKCGGCNLMHMNLEDQLEYKNEMIKDIFKRYLNEKIKIEPIINLNEYNYRNKITFQVNKKIGFYQNKTNSLIEIDECLIANKKINNILKIIKDNLKLDTVSKIIIRASENTDDIMVIIETSKDLNTSFLEKQVSSIVIKNKNYKTVYGKNKIIENLGPYSFWISPNAFFQTNTLVATKLYDSIIELADFNQNDNALDLFCGTGTISIYISPYVKKVIGIEINEDAVNDANENKKLNKVENVLFKCGDVGTILNKETYHPDVVIVDPPRSGLDKKAINELLKINAKKIIYVSCNPITLARDLNLLNSSYEVKVVRPFDMFPNTYHVECVSLLYRKTLEK